MRFFHIVRLRLRSLFFRAAVEQELEEELQYHLQRETEQQIGAGFEPDEAHCAARRIMANLEQRKEECRDVRRVNVIENIFQDVRYAARQMKKNPGFTVTSLAILALGLCASIAIFAFADAALIKPLPYRGPARLVGIYETNPACPRCNLSYFDYLDWKRLTRAFQSLEAYTGEGFIVTTASGAEPIRAARVSSGFFRTLGTRPVLGRDFHSGEDASGAAHVVLLSYAAWQKRYAGRPNIIGRKITLDNAPHEIIGVLPRDFHFAPVGDPELWTTLNPSGYCEQRRSCHNLFGIGRLKDGVSPQAALADTTLITRQLEKQYPDSNRGQGANVVPLTQVIIGAVRPILWLLLSGAGLLTLSAYINVASLLLVRSETRRREIAVRNALGAGRLRLFRQFVTEGLVLVAGASAIGVTLAHWTILLLTSLLSADMLASMPYLQEARLSMRVLEFSGTLVMAAAILFALTPVLYTFWSQIRPGLAEGSRGSSGFVWRRLGSKLVVIELSMAMVLLVGAMLLGKSLCRLLRVELGFEPERLATTEVIAPISRYAAPEQQVRLARNIVSKLQNLPGVTAVGLTSLLPVTYNGNTDWIRFVGRPYSGEHNEVNERNVSSGYFKTIGARLLRGRYFTDGEDLSKPKVVVINEALARKYFPNEDPIGKQIGDTQLSPGSLREIVGIVKDIREGPLDSDIWPAEYLPINQATDRAFSVVVRTSVDEASMLPVLTSSIHQIDANVVTRNETVMQQRIRNSDTAYLHRSAAWLVGGFATLALVLGVAGIYGVIAYSVSQRTREIGVRVALGAQRRTVYALILKEASILAVFGLCFGALAWVAVGKLFRSQLFGVSAWDLQTIASVAIILIASALLASYIPARTAASVNPVEALRAE